MPKMVSRRLLLAGLAALTLAACSSYAPTTATPAISVTPEQMLAEINTVRRQQGKAPLVYNSALAQAARGQARLMAERDQLSHNFGPGNSLRERVSAVGYTGPVGENLAGGQRTLEAVMQGWLDSSGHRSTLLSERWTSVGMVMVPAHAGSRYGVFWAAIFGT